MRLTLDLDNCTFREVLNKLDMVLWFFPHKRVEFWLSSRKGYHIIVYDTGLTFEEALELRKELGDDPKRVEIDEKRFSQGLCCNVLFNSKQNGLHKSIQLF